VSRRKQREQERVLRKLVRCGGDLELRGDRATSTARGVLREIAVACRRCHAPRTLWFRVRTPAAN
jgi:hypothetical protein